MTEKTMYAAVVEELGQPLVLRRWDVPTPGPGQILVRTEACGVCHNDLHSSRGGWQVKPDVPFIPGHEGVGIVVALGVGVTSVKEGDRVGVPWLYSACGRCEYCLTGWEMLCAEAQFAGYTRNGSFAEYVLAESSYVARIPDNLAATDAAPILCAGVTIYRGIKEAGVSPGQWIAIYGAGGLGLLAIQYAKAIGLKICAIDINDCKLLQAHQLGADAIVNATHGDLISAVMDSTQGGAHGVLITAPSLTAFKRGLAITRRHGTCVLLGLPAGEFSVPLQDIVTRCITIRGSFGGNRQDMVEALALAAQGKVMAGVQLQPLSAINQVIERIDQGDVVSHMVIKF